MRSESNKAGWTDKELAQRAVAIGVAAMGQADPTAATDRLLHREFTPDEMRRARDYINSGQGVTGR
jgi:hypothetical protein